MRIKHFVQIYFDMDFPQLPDDELWVYERMIFFKNFTLRSLLEQTFQDFKILLLCGRTFKHMTKSWSWDKKIILCYDKGREAIRSSETDFISITRLDSDDLYHREAIADVTRNIHYISDRRECLIFRQGWTWDKLNRFIIPRHRLSGPFYTHIFPRSIYKNWQQFSNEHFMGHGRAGGRLPDTVELPDNRYCVIKHQANVGYDRLGREPKKFSDDERRLLKEKHPDGIFDREKMKSILNEFGVPEDRI